MFALLRTYLRYAGRIGWVDGRRGYPSEEQYQELALHRPPPVAAAAAEVAESAEAVAERFAAAAPARQPAAARN
jgi:hypothetical protein